MRDRDAVIHAWCVKQLAYWQALRPDYRSTLDSYAALNACEDAVFLYRIQGGAVTLVDKPAFYTREAVAARSDGLLNRALLFRSFLARVVRNFRPKGEGTLAISLHDGPFESDTVPVFALQKPASSRAILLNDVDFLVYDFHHIPSVADRTPYARKQARAVFVGSTTGSRHTEDSVAGLRNPRLAAAMAFRDSAHVDFKLPIITQCDTEAAADQIRALGFGVGDYGWPYQFRHKFIISMDGNGAAFSRVAIALKSHSALLKYDSPNELYYDDGLIPWLHYIPISDHRQVAQIVQAERTTPGFYKYVADAGQAFSRSFISRSAVMTYAAKLIEMYFKVFD